MSSVAENAARPRRSRARPRAVPIAHRRVLIRDAYPSRSTRNRGRFLSRISVATAETVVRFWRA